MASKLIAPFPHARTPITLLCYYILLPQVFDGSLKYVDLEQYHIISVLIYINYMTQIGINYMTYSSFFLGDLP